jgi:O-antigen/teichoic acid export membrane protein
VRVLISSFEQGLAALLAFGINLWLIRTGSGSAYGVYVFWYNVALVCSNVLGSLTIAHLFPLPPGAAYYSARRGPEGALLAGASLIIVASAVACTAFSMVLGDVQSRLGETSAGLFVAGYLLYAFVRALAFSRGKVVLPTLLTGAVLIAAVIAVPLESYLDGWHLNAGPILATIGLIYGLCSLAILLHLCNESMPEWNRATVRRYFRDYVRASGWMLLGAMATDSIGRFYTFVITGWFGPVALARLSATQMLQRPAWLVLQGWSQVSRPAMSATIASEGVGMLPRQVERGIALTFAASMAWCVPMVLFWPTMTQILYGGRYADGADLGVLWAGNVALGCAAMTLSNALQAMGAFRPLAFADIGGAIASIGSTFVLIYVFGPIGSVAAIMIGQVTQIGLMAACFVLRVRRRAILPATHA